MKKIIVALMVLSTVVSCGKNGNVVGAAISANPLTVSGQTESSLGSMIDNDQFGTGAYRLSNGYSDSFKRFIDTGANFTYSYSSKTNTDSVTGNNCRTYLSGFYTYCPPSITSYSTMTVDTSPVTATRLNSTVILLDKKNQLKDLINRRILGGVQSVGNSKFIIMTSDGNKYVIDTSAPMQANPVEVTVGAITTYLRNDIRI